MRVTSAPSRSRIQLTSAPRPTKTSAATSSTSLLMPPSCPARAADDSPDDGRAGGRDGRVVDVPTAEERPERQDGRLLAAQRDPGGVRGEAGAQVDAAAAGVGGQVGAEDGAHVAEPQRVAGTDAVLTVEVGAAGGGGGRRAVADVLQVALLHE